MLFYLFHEICRNVDVSQPPGGSVRIYCIQTAEAQPDSLKTRESPGISVGGCCLLSLYPHKKQVEKENMDLIPEQYFHPEVPGPVERIIFTFLIFIFVFLIFIFIFYFFFKSFILFFFTFISFFFNSRQIPATTHQGAEPSPEIKFHNPNPHPKGILAPPLIWEGASFPWLGIKANPGG